MNKNNIQGQRFGRLVAVRENGRTLSGAVLWLFQCDCGGYTSCRGIAVRNGHTQSCGCVRIQANQERSFKHGASHNNVSLYTTWMGMRARCRDESHKDYHNYGGRGISVCERWNDYNLFVSDMGPKPTPLHTVDRIDNNGNYEPSNCRWATRSEQRYNSGR